jgi:hypothetical protein
MKRPTGPKPLPPNKKRRNRVAVFLTDGEFRQLKKLAGSKHIPSYVRTRALGLKETPTIPEANKEIWAASANLQNNLNQLVRQLSIRQICTKDVEEARTFIVQLRLSLLGIHK